VSDEAPRVVTWSEPLIPKVTPADLAEAQEWIEAHLSDLLRQAAEDEEL
jgi:hypothetical protein